MTACKEIPGIVFFCNTFFYQNVPATDFTAKISSMKAATLPHRKRQLIQYETATLSLIE